MSPEYFRAKTDFGSFTVKITGKTLISLGAEKQCVQIQYNSNNESELLWLGTKEGGCEVSGKDISGSDTQNMIYLATTIFRERFPDATEIHLIDSSSLDCELPRRVSPMSMMKTSLLLHGQTYYQKKLGAYPRYKKDIENIEEFIKNRKDPSYKPLEFNFNNPELNEELQPIYTSSTTWEEFFIKLKDKYQYDLLCKLMYPWYLQAFGKIAKGAITADWSIRIDDKPLIQYAKEMRGGSGRKTRKQYKNITNSHRSDNWIGQNVYFISYKGII